MAKISRRGPPPAEPDLPTNIEAERTVLGYLLRGGAWRDDIGAHDFAFEREQIVWHAMAAIHAAGDDINRSRLCVELGEKKLKHIGPGYIADLDGDPKMRIEPFVAKLHEATALRNILHHAHILMGHLHSGDRTADDLIEMGASAFADLQRGRSHEEPPPSVPTWPEPIHEDGFHGIAGELVRRIEPHTEADPAALLVQCLTAWGSLIGRGPYYLAEADRHHTNLYCLLVGVTSKGRKGTSWGRIHGVFEAIDQRWAEDCQLSGLGSGEALIDSLNQDDPRRLLMEGEFARMLAVIAREGTTLSAVLRNLWDKGRADITSRAKQAHVKGGHLSVIAHITREELRRRLGETEIANGLVNRFLIACAKRSQELPFGGDSINFGDLPRRLREVTDLARKAGNTAFVFDPAARDIWEAAYHDLSEGKPGLFGAVTGRAEAQVVRLALIYMLLDGAAVIGAAHLNAALAVWRYCQDSARYVFGHAIGDPTADKVLRKLREAKELSKTEIRDLFGRNESSGEIDRGLAVLVEMGLATYRTHDTGGRPITIWRAL
jgi:hypothetical protein